MEEDVRRGQRVCESVGADEDVGGTCVISSTMRIKVPGSFSLAIASYMHGTVRMVRNGLRAKRIFPKLMKQFGLIMKERYTDKEPFKAKKRSSSQVLARLHVL